MNHCTIEQQILKRITPTPKEKQDLLAVVDKLTEDVQHILDSEQITAKIQLVGSIAKDTYLQNNVDIDLFIQFPQTTPRNALEKNGLFIGRKILTKPEECYAEHPYVRGVYKNYKTEIVPCYQIEDATQKLSAVDRTPLHTKYVITHLNETQKNEVRLLKQFLKGIGCYGAEAEIEGFSGYLCEILIINYGSFNNLLTNAQNWKQGITFTLEKANHPQFDTPLIFIDPVDNERNVASAVSEEKFSLFIDACTAYLKQPLTTFFFPNETKPWSIKKIRDEQEKRGGHYIGIRIAKPQIISENLYPQIRKSVRSICELCERHDFSVQDAQFYVDIAQGFFYIVLWTTQDILPDICLHAGPPATLKSNVEDFLKKWTDNPLTLKKPYEKDGRIYVERKRKYTDIKKLLTKEINELSLGKHVTQMMKKGYIILEQKDLLIPNLMLFWTLYLDGKRPWER